MKATTSSVFLSVFQKYFTFMLPFPLYTFVNVIEARILFRCYEENDQSIFKFRNSNSQPNVQNIKLEILSAIFSFHFPILKENCVNRSNIMILTNGPHAKHPKADPNTQHTFAKSISL